jgi:hypothetical protein
MACFMSQYLSYVIRILAKYRIFTDCVKDADHITPTQWPSINVTDIELNPKS